MDAEGRALSLVRLGTAADAVGDHRRDQAGFARAHHLQVQLYPSAAQPNSLAGYDARGMTD
jgi:hypothetical protein